mmetsp:Transcript_3403/g.12939  ORF Transcript_3403/g.12939 Transcript_3403/m.12939 type:complete len:402 (-) Transcript_3403:2297-3502(-)
MPRHSDEEEDYDPTRADNFSDNDDLILDEEAPKKKRKTSSSKKSTTTKKKKKDHDTASTGKKRKRDSSTGKKLKKKSKKKKVANVTVDTSRADNLDGEGTADTGLEFDQPPSATTAGPSAAALASESHVEDEFDSIMESAKVTGGKNATKEVRERLQKSTDESSRVLIERMREAASRDEQLLAEGRGPALHKVRMCQEVKRACSKRMMQNTLVSDGLLDVFALWLTRGGQMSELPNLHIRTTILDILLELPLASDASSDEFADFGITVDDLRQSGIGKFVKYLAVHPNETPSNKHKANQIIQKWSRLIHNLSDNYSNLAYMEVRDPKSQHRMRQSVDNVKRITDQKNPQFSTRARVPRKTGFDFIRRPAKNPVVSSKSAPAISEKQQQLQRKLNEMKRRAR